MLYNVTRMFWEAYERPALSVYATDRPKALFLDEDRSTACNVSNDAHFGNDLVLLGLSCAHFKSPSARRLLNRVKRFSLDDYWIYGGALVSGMLAHIQQVHYPRSLTNTILKWERALFGDYTLCASFVL